MAKISRKRTNIADDVPTVVSSSEIFSDGSAIELVRAQDGENLALLHWSGGRAKIAPEFRHSGRVYRPLELNESMASAIRLPSRLADYGSPTALVQEIADLFEDYVGLGPLESSQVTLWNTSNWFGDFLQNPPILVISGPDLSHAMTLFGVLQSVCRRGLVLVEISRSTFRWLPMEIRPTLLIAQPDIPPRVLSLWCASNYRGALVPGPRGTVIDAACPKAIFVGMDEASTLNGPTVHLRLPVAPANLPRLDDRERKLIAEKYQPMLAKYRLDYLESVREARFARGPVNFANAALALSLSTCIPDEPELAKKLDMVLQAEEQNRIQARCSDPDLALLEVLWFQLEGPDDEISVAALADFTNSLLRSRGENRAYSAEEIGWGLRRMNIPRRDRREGKSVRFSLEISTRVHRLVEDFGLQLAPHGDSCLDCAKPKRVDE
jgi:hypothetical protein